MSYEEWINGAWINDQTGVFTIEFVLDLISIEKISLLVNSEGKEVGMESSIVAIKEIGWKGQFKQQTIT